MTRHLGAVHPEEVAKRATSYSDSSDSPATAPSSAEPAVADVREQVELDPPLAPGAILGRYRILTPLGAGGMARVYLAVAQGPGQFRKLLVLKVLRASLATNPETIAMFLSEAQLAARLNHPNIVQTFETDHVGDTHFLVMEHLEGHSLNHVRSRVSRTGARLPLSLHLRILADVLDALHYAHELANYDGTPLHLVHRDVSAANIFLTYDGRVKLLDFGIAKAAGRSYQTRTGILKGTIRYMAPEGILCKPQDRRSDLYSMGVLLWEAVAGRRLWPAGASDYEIMDRSVRGQLPPLRYVAKDVPPLLAELIHRALARDPANRPPTARALKLELEESLAGLGAPAMSVDVGQLVAILFAKERTQTQEVVAAQLAELPVIEPREPIEDAPTALRPPTSVPSSPAAAEAETRAEVPASLAAERRRSRKKSRRKLLSAGFAVGFVAVAVVAALVIGRRSDGPLQLDPPVVDRTELLPAQADTPPIVAPANVAPSLAEAESAATPAASYLIVRAMPAHAAIFIDEERLPANPATVTVDGGVHTIRASAAGYATEERIVGADERAVVLMLEPVEAVPTRPRAHPAPAPRPPKATRAASQPSPAAKASPAPPRAQPAARPEPMTAPEPAARERPELDIDNPWQ